MAVIHSDGMSTAVRIHLQVEGMRLRVSQVGENSLILREPEDFCSGDAQLIISVDGNEIVHPIYLTDGITGRHVSFADLDQCSVIPSPSASASETPF
ncbi:hypothetical protein NA78x_006237 [Anatilimnocola sp. NA78]|uniref:hypothetical protein n=1 Tax=Anatilimnocola sp. NA78 TaxID=3415683 RepID=UPI003CE4A969